MGIFMRRMFGLGFLLLISGVFVNQSFAMEAQSDVDRLGYLPSDIECISKRIDELAMAVEQAEIDRRKEAPDDARINKNVSSAIHHAALAFYAPGIIYQDDPVYAKLKVIGKVLFSIVSLVREDALRSNLDAANSLVDRLRREGKVQSAETIEEMSEKVRVAECIFPGVYAFRAVVDGEHAIAVARRRSCKARDAAAVCSARCAEFLVARLAGIAAQAAEEAAARAEIIAQSK